MLSKQHTLRICQIASGCFLVIFIFVSIVAGQVFAPTNFTSLGQQRSTLTTFLRASVKLGDSYLIKQIFKDSLRSEYPVVFDSYIQEGEWLKRLQSIESRSPLSRDVLAATAILYDRLGDELKSRELRAKIRSIDPVYKPEIHNASQ